MITARGQRGFTIVETMIVLAVTGMLFLLAVMAVGGRQNETEFQQAINDVQSSLQQTITQVNSGDFQEANNITCKELGGRVDISLSGGSTATEGTNTNCVFVGKVLQFVNKTGSDPQQYISYPVAGLRTDSSGQICTDIACAAPVAVAPDNGTDKSFPSDGVATYLKNGLSISYMHFVNGSTTNIGAFGIMSSLGNEAGAQQFYLAPISGTNFKYDPQNSSDMQTAVQDINSNLQSSYTTAINSTASNYSVQVCLASGTTNQSGLVTIGGTGGDLNSITTTIYNGKNC
jgi:prepilin-type N-terminal cleavage/methylation domain-containing protein